MSKDWYIIYTISRREKQVVSALDHKKIVNYCPLNNISLSDTTNPQFNKIPLFKSSIFIFISNEEIELVMQIPGVLNFLYWLSEPAIIKKEEIQAIQLITGNYNNIKIEKSIINQLKEVSIKEENLFHTKINSNTKNIKILTVILSTMGFTLKAEKELSQLQILDDQIQTLNSALKKIDFQLQ
jgi:transcription antitermination factor NusG